MTKGERMTGIKIGDLAYHHFGGHKIMGIVIDIPWNGNSAVVTFSHSPEKRSVIPLYNLFIMRNGAEYKSKYGRLVMV